MAEEKKKGKAAAPAATAAAPAEQENVEASGPGARRSKGSAWTMEKVTKFARRFSSEAEWQAGHPSSYKSAAAHGWVTACKKHFRPSDNKKSGGFKRSA
jgi:hypothetical protein